MTWLHCRKSAETVGSLRKILGAASKTALAWNLPFWVAVLVS
jgi:hypothetical protein